MKLIIKGAHYYDRESDEILVPHYSGEYDILDCTKHIRKKELKAIYDDKYVKSVIGNPIIFKGNKYYNAQYGPEHVGDWELLSDLSKLVFVEENFDF